MATSLPAPSTNLRKLRAISPALVVLVLILAGAGGAFSQRRRAEQLRSREAFKGELFDEDEELRDFSSCDFPPRDLSHASSPSECDMKLSRDFSSPASLPRLANELDYGDSSAQGLLRPT